MKIQKNVPVPKIKRAKRESKYPLSKMEPGDFFFIPAREAERVKVQSNVGAAIRHYYQSQPVNGFDFITRWTEHEGRTGIGVWCKKGDCR